MQAVDGVFLEVSVIPTAAPETLMKKNMRNKKKTKNKKMKKQKIMMKNMKMKKSKKRKINTRLLAKLQTVNTSLTF